MSISMDIDIPSEARVSLFPASPLSTSLTPNALRKAIPTLVRLDFWTTEVQPLTPSKAKASISKGRKIIATLGHEDLGEAESGFEKKAKTEADAELLTPKVSTSTTHNLDELFTEKANPNLKTLLTELIRVSYDTKEDLTTLKQENKAMKEDMTIVKEQNKAMKEQNKAMKEQNRAMKEDMTIVKEQNKAMKVEFNLYSQIQSSRHSAAINLLACLSNTLNHTLKFVLHKPKHAGDLKMLIEHGVPFKKLNDVSYYKSWYFCFEQELYDPTVSTANFWQTRLGYSGKVLSSDNPERQVHRSAESSQVSKILGLLMEEAELSLLETGPPDLSHHKVHDAVGLYFCLLRLNRNYGKHFFEKFYCIQENRWRGNHREIFADAMKEMSLKQEQIPIATEVLNDLLTNLDSLVDLACVKDVIAWFAGWLLGECNGDEEGIWEWYEEIGLALWFDATANVFKDYQHRHWREQDGLWYFRTEQSWVCSSI